MIIWMSHIFYEASINLIPNVDKDFTRKLYVNLLTNINEKLEK